MNYSSEEIFKALKIARESKGLSQRALAKKSGVLQTQISKIENGATDFRLSTLVALARALDLELTLIPRKAVSAVQSVVRASKPAAARDRTLTTLQNKEYERLGRVLADLPDTTKLTTEYAQLQRYFRDIQKFQLDIAQLERVRETAKALKAMGDVEKTPKALRDQGEVPKELRHATAEFQNIRNDLAQVSANVPGIEAIKPAYTLDDDERDG